MPLWRHQQAAVDWALPRKAAVLHHGMGSGKTLTALSILLHDLEATGRLMALVCCPKAVIAAWQKQHGLWAPHVRIVALTKNGSAAKERQFVAAAASTEPLIVVCNYESVWRIKAIEKAKWTALVWDEGHRLKSPSGVASRWAAKMSKGNTQARRLLLSGTLIPHSVLDLWAIYRSIEAPACETFGDSYTMHKATFAVVPPGQSFVTGYRNLKLAHEKVAATSHHIRSQDVLDLPPITCQDVPVELHKDEAALYREIERDFCAVVENGTVTPANALVQLLRLQQVCGGFVRFDGEPVARRICDRPAKAAAFLDMIEDLPSDEPVVVFCRFRSDMDSCIEACRKAGRSVSELSGARNQLSNWQQGETTVLVAQIQSGGIGIDLTRASYCWFFSLGYALADYDQAVARLHRPGQQKHTHIYHLVAQIDGRSTVDGAVHEAIRGRRDIVNDILDGYRRGRENGASVGAR